ncbi:hypothetical protein EYR40_002959 [Pleurotus pulmonarius]|nr:hypothetical protein EYR40_002959 [Pleurotus pulmonarius]
MEKDQVYVPKTRSDLGLPPSATSLDYHEILGDTPLYTLFMLVRQQVLGFPAYLCFNVSGPKEYPRWTNHFNLIMVTYLQHTAPEVPHYRGDAWTFTRGAAATVDRNFLGQQGKLFLHGVAHYHVVHHFFPKMPFYHGEEATRHLKKLLGVHYNSSDDSTFKSLWETYNKCQFVEDEGMASFVSIRDKLGRSSRRAEEEMVGDL